MNKSLMSEKCNPNYKNLNTIQSYAEQKYATVQWCEQNCENDEYLKQEVDDLRYLSPPNIRYNFNIVDSIDTEKSYGCTPTSENTVGFNNGTSEVLSLNFNDDDTLKVDTNKTTAKIVQDTINIVTENGQQSVEIEEGTGTTKCRLRTESEDYKVETEAVSFGTADSNTKVGSFWYIAWDASKPYYVRPDWLASWKDKEIKSICRAQTFKSEYTGKLESINLRLAWTGSKVSNCGSPLYVQIWKTYNRFVKKTKWDRENQCMVDKFISFTDLPTTDRDDWQNQAHYQKYKKYKKIKVKKKDKKGNVVKKKNKIVYVEKFVKESAKGKSVDNKKYVKLREKIKWLGHNKKKSNGKWATNIKYPLAEAEYGKVGDAFPTIAFDKPCTLKKGESYAIVMFSPLSERKHCPLIGGWTRNSKKDKRYKKGNAFMSANNGRKWIRYGKDSSDVNNNSDKSNIAKITQEVLNDLGIKNGKYTPQDYAFSCNMEVGDYKEGQINHFVEDDIIQFEPIYTNPISSVGIECGGEGLNNEKTSIIWQCSTDGNVWKELPYQGTLNFNEPYPNCILVRGLLSREEAYPTDTPILNWVELSLTTTPSKELYLRTPVYKMNMNPPLGGNLWGKVYAPFEFDATVDCNAEIIKGNTVTENFHIISIGDVDENMNLCGMDETSINSFMYTNTDNTVERTDVEKAIYLSNNTDILTELKSNNILVKPYIDGDNLYLLSFSQSYKSEDMIITKDSGTDEEPTTFDEVDFPVGSLQLRNMVAYPMRSVQIEPVSQTEGSTIETYSEVVDYKMDYVENSLTFNSWTMDNIIEGNLKIEYNPVFIKNLSNNEVGAWKNEETNRTEYGLLLDYFKETILITNEMVDNRSVSLRVTPLNPIRAVYLYKESDFTQTPVQLYEYNDYTYDIESNSLVFPVSNVDNISSILSLNDSVEVIYTPDLNDDSLCIGYYATRENNDKQVRIKDGFYEYKI